MRDALDVLIRLADWRVDAQQRLLADARRCLDDLAAERDGVSAEMTREAASAAGDSRLLAAWASYAARCKHRLDALAADIDAASERVTAAQRALRDAFAAAKRLSILAERRDRDRLAALTRRDQAAVDDLAQRRSSRPAG
jgi:flagellar FliJ protein